MSLEIVTIVGGPIQTNAYLVADTDDRGCAGDRRSV